MSDKKKVISKSKNKRKPLLGESLKRALISTLIILFFVITVGGYFVYVTGVPAKILTGVEIVKTQENGKTKVIERISVNELKYHYALVFNQYYQYGYVNADTDLDSLMPTTQMTYRQFFFERAAENIRRNVLTNNAADKAGFKPLSVEGTIEYSVQSVRNLAEQYNVTADEYLMRTYGKGMTVKGYEKILRNELITEEYQEYLKQNEFWLTSDEMQAMYDANPTDYGTATFNYYFFPATYADTATDAEKATAAETALENANAVIAETDDAGSFRDACEKYAGETKASSFADGADPTLADGYSKDTTTYISPEIADYIYAAGRIKGDKQVIVTASGAYAVYFDSITYDTTPTYAYRILILENKEALAVDPQDAIDETAALTARLNELKTSTTDEQSFVTAAKKYSEDYSTKPAGGLTTGVLYETYAQDAEPSEHDKALAGWLFSPERKAGDMIIIENGSYVNLYYFVDSVPAWQNTLREKTTADQLSAWIDAQTAAGSVTYKINYNNIKLAGN